MTDRPNPFTTPQGSRRRGTPGAAPPPRTINDVLTDLGASTSPQRSAKLVAELARSATAQAKSRDLNNTPPDVLNMTAALAVMRRDTTATPGDLLNATVAASAKTDAAKAGLAKLLLSGPLAVAAPDANTLDQLGSRAWSMATAHPAGRLALANIDFTQAFGKTPELQL